MADLSRLLVELDLQAPRTLLQSGNVVFPSGARSTMCAPRDWGAKEYLT